MSILFLLLGIMLVNFCNPGAIDEAQLSKTMYFLYDFIGFAVYIFPVPILLKYNKAKDKKDRSLLVVALTLIVYDLFNLLFIKLSPMTYVLQLVVVLLYFLYQKWKEKH
ncbi:hypothetical protein [Dubosiella newyorkensis]|uniref:hypothetical protein n=1 Tax=Dubosiella newyorkensis TaxID=1862672 RepID=UPI0032B24207